MLFNLSNAALENIRRNNYDTWRKVIKIKKLSQNGVAGFLLANGALPDDGHRLEELNLQDVHFVAFHVTGSLDDCQEIKESGIRNLQYVLSHDTMLSSLLRRGDITFDIHYQL